MCFVETFLLLFFFCSFVPIWRVYFELRAQWTSIDHHEAVLALWN